MWKCTIIVEKNGCTCKNDSGFISLDLEIASKKGHGFHPHTKLTIVKNSKEYFNDSTNYHTIGKR